MRKWSKLLSIPARTPRRSLLAGVMAVLAIAIGGALLVARAQNPPKAAGGEARIIDDSHVELTESQVAMIAVEAVGEHPFPAESEAVGSIDFNEDLSTPVFAPYQGRIVRLYAQLGDSVSVGQTLFTIESPDLIQAESALIAAAGVLELTTRALERAKELFGVQGIAEKDLQQAVSDQQTAEGALQAARNAVEVFGKSRPDIDRVIASRTIDPYLVVPSPIAGRITARNAAPGMLLLPGAPPAPYAVADVSRVWMNASVTESDMPLMRVGQRIDVTVMAFPGRAFGGRVSAIGATVDPQLHRGLVRVVVDDPKRELLPGMFAAFVITTEEATKSPAVPIDAVIREGDGSLTVWVASDPRHFARRVVRVGRSHQGYDQVLDGVRAGERVVRKGAILLDNLVGGGLS